jgi:uncharacterized protein (UPF0216 family)
MERQEGEMPEVDRDDMIPIQEAVGKYDRNRKTLDRLIDERKLSVVKVTGDRKTYLLRSELERLFQPHIVQRAEEGDAG